MASTSQRRHLRQRGQGPRGSGHGRRWPGAGMSTCCRDATRA